jgi:vacuolar-type H+-ATPase catalytic subunit A/Vma1
MPVTDDQVAPLRAQLAGQPEEHLRLFNLLDQNAKNTGYQALVSAAFVTAVQRRFAPEASLREVVEFVGSVRSRSPQVAEKIDPVIAERVIMGVLADDSLDDIDARKSFETQLVLMAAIVGGENLDDAGLDAFLAQARKLADQWLA